MFATEALEQMDNEDRDAAGTQLALAAPERDAIRPDTRSVLGPVLGPLEELEKSAFSSSFAARCRYSGTPTRFPWVGTSTSSDVLFGNTGEIGPNPGTEKPAKLQVCASANRALSNPRGATAVAAAAPVMSRENSRRDSDFIH